MPLKTFALYLFLLLASAPLSAQTYERSFGLEFAPHQGGRRISAGAGIPLRQIEERDSIENGIGGFGIGLLYESRADKIGFTTGVRYLTTGYESETYGFNGPTIGEDFRDEVKAQYVEIPFELNFHQEINPTNRVSFMLGVAANVHLKTTTRRTSFFDGADLGTEVVADGSSINYRPAVLSLNTGMAFDRKFGNDWAVKLQPYFRFFLQGNLQPESDDLNRNFYQTGVRIVVKRIW